MAQYRGYITIPCSTYDVWRAQTINNSYDVDYFPSWQPYQCWDYCALLYFQYGRILRTKAGGGSAPDCWTYSKAYNSQTPFVAVEGKENIKRGDIVILNYTGTMPDGHIAFADEDYNGTNYIRLLGQNQGGTPLVNTMNYSLSSFLGVFRNTKWQSAPSPTPSPTSDKKKKFPWAVAWAHWSNFRD